MRRLAIAALVVASASTARAAPDDAAVSRFDRLADELVGLCVHAAATRCFETAFDLVDADGDDRLTRAELDALRRDANAWFVAERDGLTVNEQTAVALGLATLNTAGVDRLVAAYDADGDGALDREEVTADVRLDERPLPQLVRDGAAVDWEAVRGRLGALAGALLPAPP
jgi:hypothetical protein